MMIRRDQGEDADLFADELFQRTQTWKLSTSGLSAGHHFKGTGFGSGWKDGYGINCASEITITIQSADAYCRPGRAGYDQVWHRVEAFVRRDFDAGV